MRHNLGHSSGHMHALKALLLIFFPVLLPQLFGFAAHVLSILSIRNNYLICDRPSLLTFIDLHSSAVGTKIDISFSLRLKMKRFNFINYLTNLSQFERTKQLTSIFHHKLFSLQFLYHLLQISIFVSALNCISYSSVVFSYRS
jgi:hypothetical protein